MSKEWIGLTTPEGRGVWVRASEVEAVVDTKDAREVWTAAGAYDVREPIGDVLAALGVGAVPAAPDGPFAGVKFHTFVDGSILDEGWAEVRCADGRKFRFRVSGDGHPAEPATEPAPGSDEDWREAMRVVREVEPAAYTASGDAGNSVWATSLGSTREVVWLAERVGAGEHDPLEFDAAGTPLLYPTATAAARAYVASRRADPTPGPLVVDGWTLDLQTWCRGDETWHAILISSFESGRSAWEVRGPLAGNNCDSGIAKSRADALAAATAALRTHYGRSA